jgi:hypothetical protein
MSDVNETAQELVARLRNPPFGTETSERNLMSAAADWINAALAREAGLKDALDPFAAFAALTVASRLPDDHIVIQGSRLAAPQITVGHMRKARDALEAPE